MKDLNKALSDYESGWNADIEQRDKSVEDRRFVDVHGAQWEGACGQQYKNKQRLEFDKISREINRIIGEGNANPITVKFIPDDQRAEKKAADILQNRFRNDWRKSGGIEATDNASSEAWKGGIGAWRLAAKYEDEYDPDQDEQFISFEPIFSADATVIFDADAKRLDKSDAKQCWLLHEYTRKEFDRKHPGKAPFRTTELPDFYDFDWYGPDIVYVAEYFEVMEKSKERLVFMTPQGEKVKHFKDDLKDNEELTLELSQYEQIGSERVKVRVVEKALVCGDSYLEEPEEIPCDYIPIIPQYGYWSYIKGKEYYMGEVRKQRDRQVFNNMAVSMLGELMTESQKEKPIFAPEQMTTEIAKMWSNDNVENHTYLLAKALRNPDGSIAVPGPIGKTSAPNVPPALVSSLQWINQDMAEELGTGELNIPANTSGAAVQQVQSRADMSYFILLNNRRKAMQHCGRVWLSMAKRLYGGVARSLRTVSEDGAIDTVQTMQPIVNQDGTYGFENDLGRGRFEVVTETGPAYSSRVEAERATLLGMLQATDTNSPMYPLLLAQLMQKMDGEGGDTIRKFARYQELQMLLQTSPLLVQDEIKNEEEERYVMAMMQQMQQPQEPDPMMQIAMTEAQTKQISAEASMIKAQNDQANTQLKAIDTQSQATLREAQTVETYAQAQEISQKSTRDSMKLVSDIRATQQKDAISLAQSLRG